ncbi:acyltransferase family protein [Arthrobacter agilis]|uniref:acyltransferase family protein n=1 Tax=Arthrobacter agilis TaxID=37921 RepID=UPI00278B2F9E|nr:acyltransferase [Arthrobacter agilis]MDQ0735880.1 putative membrane protein YcfT [Arthrobacter agilis]
MSTVQAWSGCVKHLRGRPSGPGCTPKYRYACLQWDSDAGEAIISGTQGARIGWLDSLRGAAILLVVVLHAGEALRVAVGSTPGLDQFNLFLEPFRMPVLMFLSGILLPQSLAKSGRRYFAGKASRVAWPYVLWSVITLAATGELGPVRMAEVLYRSPTYLWYLWFILVFYALAYPLRRVPPLWIAGSGLALSFVLPHASRPGTMAFLAGFFFFGAWCARSAPLVQRTIGRPWVLAMAAASAVTVGVLNVAGRDVLYRGEFVWGVVGALGVVCWAFPRLGANRATAALEFVGRHSIVFYVVHLAPIMVTLALADAAGLAGTWLLPLLLVTGVGIPLGIAWVYSTREHASVDLLFEAPALGRRAAVTGVGARRSRA